MRCMRRGSQEPAWLNIVYLRSVCERIYGYGVVIFSVALRSRCVLRRKCVFRIPCKWSALLCAGVVTCHGRLFAWGSKHVHACIFMEPQCKACAIVSFDCDRFSALAEAGCFGAVPCVCKT